MSVLLAMLLLLLTWLLAGAVVLGLGLAVWRLCGLESWQGMTPGVPIPPDVLFDGEGVRRGPADPLGRGDAVWRVVSSWWLGLIALVGLLQAWHLALRVDAVALGLIGALGVTGLWWCRAELKLAWAQLCGGEGPGMAVPRGLVLAWLLGGVWLSNRAAGFSVEPATGLAWLPLVRWADAYAAVPGVGNVNPVYGWNAGWLLVCSWLSVGPWDGRIGHVGGGWVLWWLWLSAVLGWRQVWGEGASGNKKADVGSIYAATLALPVVVLGLGPGVTDPLPGVVSSALVLVAAGCVLRACGPEEFHRGRRIDALLVSVGVSLGGFAVDPLAWPAFLGLLGFSLWRLLFSEGAWVEGRRPTRSIGVDHEKLPGLAARNSSVAAVGLLAGSLLVLWVARNVVMTGYVFFPWRQISLPLDWAVPNAMADVSRWLPRAQPGALVVGTLGAVVLPGVLGMGGLVAWFGRGGAEGRWKSCAGVGVALLVGVAGWYLVSARGVSATGPAWALAGVALALNARTIAKRGRPVKGPTGRQLAAVLGGAAALAGVIHLGTGAGAGLWPLGKEVTRAFAVEADAETESRSASAWPVRTTGAEEPGLSTSASDRFGSGGRDGATPRREELFAARDPGGWLPVRVPWVSEGGLEERREPALRYWVSRWGVEVGLSGPHDESAFAVDTEDGLPWWAVQPSVLVQPSEHLRYRNNGASAANGGDVSRGFLIDRRGAGSLLETGGDTVRSAERGDVFAAPRDGS